MQSLLQVLKLNDPREGTTKEGRAWKMQDAECIVLNDDGSVAQVGVLMIPKALEGKVVPGVFLGSFALRADTRREGQRRINAELVDLQPYDLKRGSLAVPVPTPAAK